MANDRHGFLSLSRELRDEIYYHYFRPPQPDDFDYWDLPIHSHQTEVARDQISDRQAFAQAKSLHLHSRLAFRDRGLCQHREILSASRQIYLETWPLFSRNHRVVLTGVDDLRRALTFNTLPLQRWTAVESLALIDLSGLAEISHATAIDKVERLSAELGELLITHRSVLRQLQTFSLDYRLPLPKPPLKQNTILHVQSILPALIQTAVNWGLRENAQGKRRDAARSIDLRFSEDQLKLDFTEAMRYIRLTATIDAQDGNFIPPSMTWTNHTDVDYGRNMGILCVGGPVLDWQNERDGTSNWRCWKQHLNNIDLVVWPTNDANFRLTLYDRLHWLASSGTLQSSHAKPGDVISESRLWIRQAQIDSTLSTSNEAAEPYQAMYSWICIQLPPGARFRIAEDAARVSCAYNADKTMWHTPFLSFIVE